MMKKPVLSIDEPEPKKTLRADRPPAEGFVTIVDGHFKSELMFQAIGIDGEPYWDGGGCAGNPTISPLVRESEAFDVILVQINPRERRESRDPRAKSWIASMKSPSMRP